MKPKCRIKNALSTAGHAVVAFAFISSSALAKGWSEFGTVKNMVANPEFVYIALTTAADPDRCQWTGSSPPEEIQYTLKVDDDNYDAKLAFLMTAFASHRPVRFWLDGCRTIGNKDYPIIWSVHLWYKTP